MWRFLLPPTLLLALGCAGLGGKDEPGDNGGDDSGQDSPGGGGDADGDGYPSPEDCDDGDEAIHPGATEVCDGAGTDEDCDGLVDENDPGLVGDLLLFPDGDGDGWGAVGQGAAACAAREGWVEQEGDCDDGNGAVNPDAREVCDEADTDEDCDGLADDADSDVDPESLRQLYVDNDGDGFGAGEFPGAACDASEGWAVEPGDCADDDPAVHPGAPEECDGVDQDCDDVVDDEAEDATTWYADADGDRHGDPDTYTEACTAPRGWLADADDCDDRAADVHPGALEHCDDVDEDCDGAIDEDAADPSTWYRDGDGDGYGDGDSPAEACDAPADHIARAGDCDDARADVNPGAQEVCDDADTDEDCDGLVDDADPGASVESRVERHADADGDGYGNAHVAILMCDPSDALLTDASDCDDGDAEIHPGAVEVCDAARTDEDCDGRADDDDAGVDPSGFVTVWVDGDVDGFGGGDPLDGGCHPEAGYASVGGDCDDGRADVNPDGTEVCDAADTDEDCDGLADDADDDALRGVLRYPDLDGDSFGDAAGADMLCDPGSGWVTNSRDCDDAESTVNPSADELCFDTVDQDCDGQDACGLNDRDATARWNGAASDELGQALARVGDLDGDGTEDFAAGTNESRGELLLVSAGVTGATTLGSAYGVVVGPTSADGWTGELRARLLGDVDGDGADELAVGWFSGSDRGRVAVIGGPFDGSQDFADATRVVTGSRSADQLGASLAPAGDQDGDGVPDLWAGGPYLESSTNGAAWLLTGLDDASTTAHSVTVTGPSASRTGYALTSGDFDGDGTLDLALASPYANWSAVGSAGVVYVHLGPVTADRSSGDADATLHGSSSGDALGLSLAAGDADADGLTDLAVDTAYVGVAGGVAVWLAPSSGDHGVDLADVRITTTYASSAGPKPIVMDGDVDGDGADDLAFGDIYANPAGSYSGGAWVFAGLSPGAYTYDDASEIILGRAANDLGGSAVALLTGADGRAALLVGAMDDDDGGSNGGVVSRYVP